MVDFKSLEKIFGIYVIFGECDQYELDELTFKYDDMEKAKRFCARMVKKGTWTRMQVRYYNSKSKVLFDTDNDLI